MREYKLKVGEEVITSPINFLNNGFFFHSEVVINGRKIRITLKNKDQEEILVCPKCLNSCDHIENKICQVCVAALTDKKKTIVYFLESNCKRDGVFYLIKKDYEITSSTKSSLGCYEKLGWVIFSEFRYVNNRWHETILGSLF